MPASAPTTTYVWNIGQMDRDASDGCVQAVHYTIVAISSTLNAEGNPYTSSAYGSIGLERGDTLIPFEDLTKEQVIQWTQDKLGGAEKVAEIEAALLQRINDQITPPIAQGLPAAWAN